MVIWAVEQRMPNGFTVYITEQEKNKLGSEKARSRTAQCPTGTAPASLSLPPSLPLWETQAAPANALHKILGKKKTQVKGESAKPYNKSFHKQHK